MMLLLLSTHLTPLPILSLELQQHTVVVCHNMGCLEEMWLGFVAVMVVVPWWEALAEQLLLLKVDISK